MQTVGSDTFLLEWGGGVSGSCAEVFMRYLDKHETINGSWVRHQLRAWGVGVGRFIHLGLACLLDVGVSNCVLSHGLNAEDLDPNQEAPALTSIPDTFLTKGLSISKGKSHLTRAFELWPLPYTESVLLLQSFS